MPELDNLFFTDLSLGECIKLFTDDVMNQINKKYSQNGNLSCVSYKTSFGVI